MLSGTEAIKLIGVCGVKLQRQDMRKNIQIMIFIKRQIRLGLHKTVYGTNWYHGISNPCHAEYFSDNTTLLRKLLSRLHEAF